jgi:hypothetical protein
LRKTLLTAKDLLSLYIFGSLTLLSLHSMLHFASLLSMLKLLRSILSLYVATFNAKLLRSILSLYVSSCFIFIFERGQIFQIESIDASISPPLYSLIDLLKDKVPGHFYKEQLTKAPVPDYKKRFFFCGKSFK